jgi:nucleoid-associated protein EbfC
MNMMKLMKQASEMQKNMEKMQAELAKQTVSFSSGGGMVTVEAAGDMSIKSIKIDPKVIDPDDPEMLEDLVLAGVDGAMKAAKDLAAAAMKNVTGGMGLPGGGGLPF